MGQEELISFDILLKGHNKEGSIPSTGGIDDFKPPYEHIIICHRYFTENGITCHPTDFGLACQATRSAIEKVFSCSLAYHTADKYSKWDFATLPSYPEEIGKYIDQVTFSASPDFF